MTKPDAYYGSVAEAYDSSREWKQKWKNEHAAVEKFLTEGPVLDVPFGTGRFVPIYRAKGLTFSGVDISPDMLAIAHRKYPGVNATIGSAFDLPYSDGEFATAVCVRFLEWIHVERAASLIARLKRIAKTLIVTIVHGQEGRPEAFTYDYGKWLGAIDGLLIADRRITAHVRDMVSEIFKLRPACWADVIAQFSHDHPGKEAENVQRLADKFAGFFGLPEVEINEGAVNVRAEYWSGARIGAVVESLSAHKFLTPNYQPRRMDMPATVIERDGVALMIDGRKRANIWMNEAGPHPILVVRLKT